MKQKGLIVISIFVIGLFSVIAASFTVLVMFNDSPDFANVPNTLENYENSDYLKYKAKDFLKGTKLEYLDLIEFEFELIKVDSYKDLTYYNIEENTLMVNLQEKVEEPRYFLIAKDGKRELNLQLSFSETDKESRERYEIVWAGYIDEDYDTLSVGGKYSEMFGRKYACIEDEDIVYYYNGKRIENLYYYLENEATKLDTINILM